MKKNIFRFFAAIIIVTLVIAPPLAYSSLLAMAVHRINPSALMKIGGGAAKIPAVVKSVSTNGSTAFNVLNLTLTGAQLGGIAGAVIGTGVGLGIYAANPSWFLDNGVRVLSKVPGVEIVKDTVVQVPPPDAAPDYDYDYTLAPPYADGADYGIGYFQSDCEAAADALMDKCKSLRDRPDKCVVGDKSSCNCIRQKVTDVYHTPEGSQSQIHFRIFAYCKFSNDCSWEHIDQIKTENIGQEGLVDTMVPQLNDNNQNAWGLLMDILSRISAALNNPSHEINAEPGLMDDIQSRLKEGISETALSDIEESTEAGTGDGAVPADANDVYGLNAGDVVNAVLDALKGQELSSRQIADAIQKALANNEGLTAADIAQKIWAAAPNAVTNPQYGVGNAANTIDRAIDKATTNIVDAIKDEDPNVDIPIDPDVLMPDKLSLTSVFDSFYSGLQSLPMVQTFQGLAITAGGSSSLCLDLPSEFGGNRCMDFSSYGSALNAIGSVLLSMTTLFMMVYLFRG